MDVLYTENVRQRPAKYALLQKATVQLEGILGPSQGTVRAEWDCIIDHQHRPLFVLKLRDALGGVIERPFEPDELTSPFQMAFRLHRLWGDLLQDQNERHLEALSGAGS